jgi:hypothetical protein
MSKSSAAAALRGLAEFDNDATGDRPFAAKRSTHLLSCQRGSREPYEFEVCHPDLLVGDAADASPQPFRRIAQQGR